MSDNPATRPIRILIAHMPVMLADIIAGILDGERDLAVVGQTAVAPETIMALGILRPRVVITRFTMDGELAAVLAVSGGARVLGISVDGPDSLIHELRPRERALGELTRMRLLQAVRA